jgi:Domain of unknown function (DUF3387)
VRKNVTIDWTLRENVRSQMRVLVRRILRRYGYPPDKQEKGNTNRTGTGRGVLGSLGRRLTAPAEPVKDSSSRRSRVTRREAEVQRAAGQPIQSGEALFAGVIGGAAQRLASPIRFFP